MTRREKNNRKIDERRQVQREAAEIVRRYNAATQVAARATGMQYANHGTVARPYYRPELGNPLARHQTDTGRTIADGQTRANGKDLAPLPRYTA